MSNLRSLFIMVAALGLGLSCAAYATAEQKATTSTEQTTLTAPTKIAKEQIKEKININTATAEDLEKVKYLGKKKAKAIVDYRTANGEFKSLDDLLKVKCRGVTKKWLEKISGSLTI